MRGQESPAVEFRVLGPVEAVRDGSALDLGGPRLKRLLCLLLLEPGRIVSSDRLIDEIWAGEPPDGAETTLRSYVSRLRTQLGGVAIRGTAAGYVLETAPESIDSYRFQALTREADEASARVSPRRAAHVLRAGLELWRGEPFAGLADDGALRAEAERLEELRLHAIETRVEADLALGEAAGLVDDLERLTALHPFRERLWHSLMLALYRAGRQADALNAYQRARDVLDEQLGLEPGEELEKLQGAILRHEVAPVEQIASASNLPADLTVFVGRLREIAEIEQRLALHRLVTLTGVGGVGKTRLGLEVARRVRASESSDEVYFVDLAPVGEPADVARQIAHSLDVREHSGSDLAGQVGERLARGRVLLLLDNAEHLVPAVAPLIESLLEAAPDLRVLATSRIPLGAVGELDYAVPPLDTPAPDASSDELRQSSAVQLLLSRVEAAQGHAADGERVLAEAARICRDLDGLPLAIELAAARSKALSLSEIAARLDDRLRFLVSWRRLAPARHQTLRQALDWSYDLLSADEQRFFAHLAVFAGGFTLEASAAIAADAADDALDIVTRLVDASLVVTDKSVGATRYRLLETVRQYAADRLELEGGADSARGRHAAYYRALAERAEPELSGGGQSDWFVRLDADHDNLRAALSYAATQDDAESLLAFTVSLTRFWYVRGHLSEARQRLEAALSTEGSLPPLLRRRGLTAAASIALLQGDYDAALAWARASLDAARATGEERLVANALSNLGAIALAAGEVDRAGGLLREAVALARTVGDQRILALALNNLADHALTVGDYPAAEPLFQESLELLRGRGDTANVARSLFNLGAVALGRDDLDTADGRFRDSLTQSHAAGDKEDLSWSLLGLASVAARNRDAERAATLSGAAVALLEQMGAQFKPFERRLHAETEQLARDQLGDTHYAEARERGARLGLAQAVELART